MRITQSYLRLYVSLSFDGQQKKCRQNYCNAKLIGCQLFRSTKKT